MTEQFDKKDAAYKQCYLEISLPLPILDFLVYVILFLVPATSLFADPTGLTGTAVSPTEIDYSWSDPYSYDLSPCGDGTVGLNFTGGSITYSTDCAGDFSAAATGLSPNTTYYLQVVAYYDWGSAETGYVGATTPGPPNVPSSFSATLVTGPQVNLSWINNGGGQTGFEVYRATGSCSSFTSLGTVGASTTTYSDTSLTPGTTYCYEVESVNGYGNSAPSNTSTITVPSLPAAPSGLSATTVSGTEISLAWTDNSDNETGFKIERSLSSGSGYSQIALTVPNTTSYSDRGASTSTTYYYRVRATNTGGDSAYSNVANATTTAAAGGGTSTSGTRTSGFEYDATTGLLTKEVVEPTTSDLCLVTAYTYDAYGNKTAATSRNCNGTGIEAAAPTGGALFTSRTSSTGYDSQGRFATSATNALSQGETRAYNSNFGTVASLTGPNSLTTTWSYDGFGRKTLEVRADGTQTAYAYLYCSGVDGGSASCPTNGAYLIETTPEDIHGTTDGPITMVYYDALNREIRTQTQGFSGTAIYKDTQYDSLGRVSQVSQPYYTGATPSWTVYTYDILGRVTQLTAPDGGITTTTYDGLVTTTTNALGQTEVRYKNSQGQLIQVNRQ